MPVLHVIHDTDRRGSQVFASDLAAVSERLGHTATVVALVQGNERPGLGVEILGTKSDAFTTVWALRNRMKTVDVTVAHGPAAGRACVRAASRSTRFVYRQVRDTRFWRRRPPRPKKAPPYMSGAAVVAALSPGARNDLVDLLGLPPGRVVAIPNGVPSKGFHVPSSDERHVARRSLDIDDDVFVAMTVGALVASKGVDNAIRSVVDLDDVHLVVAGDGPERPQLERLAAGIAPDKVTFAGFVPDVMRAYASADLVVHPSVSGDSMPRVLIESGFCGIAAVASAIGSSDDVVLNGRTGLLVPADDVGGLAGATKLMRVGRVGRQQMGEAAREHCLARFDIEVVAKQWSELLAVVSADQHRT